MPHDPVIYRQDALPHTKHGEHDIVLVRSYEAPAGPDGEIAFDPWKEKNEKMEEDVFGFLSNNFPVRYLWKVKSYLEQGVVLFNIPVLMGMDTWYVVNLRTHPDFGPAVVDGAGEILERYLLPRDKFHLGRFLEARAEHSILISRWKKVPG